MSKLLLSYAISTEELENIERTIGSENDLELLIDKQMIAAFIKGGKDSKNYFKKVRESDWHSEIFVYSTFTINPDEMSEIVKELKQVESYLMRHYELDPMDNSQSYANSKKIAQIINSLVK